MRVENYVIAEKSDESDDSTPPTSPQRGKNKCDIRAAPASSSSMSPRGKYI